MPGVTQQLKKLRTRSLREIGVRGRQELGKLSERVSGAGEMSDRALLSEISPASRNCSSEGSALLIVERIQRNLEKKRLPADGGTVESVLGERGANDRLVHAFLVCGDRLEVSGIQFSSYGQVKYCAIGIGGDSVELSIAGADRFDLTMPEGLSRLQFNGSTFELKPGQRYGFSYLGSAWVLTA